MPFSVPVVKLDAVMFSVALVLTFQVVMPGTFAAPRISSTPALTLSLLAVSEPLEEFVGAAELSPEMISVPAPSLLIVRDPLAPRVYSPPLSSSEPLLTLIDETFAGPLKPMIPAKVLFPPRLSSCPSPLLPLPSRLIHSTVE